MFTYSRHEQSMHKTIGVISRAFLQGSAIELLEN